MCVVNNQHRELKFIIVDLNVQPVLSAAACTALNLVQRIDSSLQVSEKCNVNLVNTQSSDNVYSSSVTSNLSIGVPNSSNNSISHPHKLLKLIEEYSDIFEGVGRLPGKHKIILHEDATPVIAASRKIPLALENKLKDELFRMEQNGIIEKVTKPTDWVNPIVVVPKKDGSIRICLDPRPLNKYIKRQHYQIPSQDQLLSKLNGSKVFSLLDAKNAFYHIQLDEESSDLCTFITPFGRFRFLVMPFGLKSAPEVYQKVMDNIFEDCPDIDPYFDDIMVYSKNMIDHYEKLKKVFQVARESGLNFNKDKAKIAVSELQYLGHIISPDGVSPDPKKVSADFPVPTIKQELMRFLGMATYLMKFVPKFSQETSILRDLLKKDTNWLWDSHHNEAFLRVKDLLQSTTVLKFFDKDKPIVLSVDASSFGIGGVLQTGQPVAYTSATLSEAQSRYSQIEKELLAIVHACEHFHYYVFGQHVEIETDHKPLLGLIHRPFENISPRLQRLLLCLQRYSFKLIHVPGKYLAVADTLSRAPLPTHPVSTSDIDNAQLMVSLLVQASKSKLDEILLETKNDIELQSITNYIENGWPERKSVVLHAQPYWQCQSELHIKNGLVCRGQRLVIPKSCRKDVLQRLHIGHRGIVSCKNLARQSLYWPDSSVVNALKTCFARFGIPEEIVADNGPPFDSREFIEFCTNWDIFFNPSSPGFPRSNGQVERCVQTVKSSLVKAAQDKNDAHLVLMEYRNTPMDGLPSPAEILMGRRIRTLIPTLPSQFDPHYDCSAVQERLRFRQQRQHKYDLHSRPLKPLQENQKVVFHLNNQWCKGKVSRVGPQPRSYIIKAENGREYRRNRLHIKVLKPTQSLNPRTTAEDLFMAPTSSNRTNNPVAQTHLSVSNSFPVVTQTCTPVCNTARTTRTGRTIIPPQRFMDYA
ncbi:Retrovirus-related Pol polyprotein from transposon 17.6 [Araneus ventricosus]|uniref:RNA-directed DNA polymerase n=1 Tax=Araneus ventricosus TaxID=182803 RepID=A0A4Y2M270_ARAVE|nr:Retrovirus-related Pol polyprotein from transposon 17.6 [Araneus ventricosus]